MNPQIYVVCLASYNNGIFHGDWIDCDRSAEEIRLDINNILKTSPTANAEDFAIHEPIPLI